MRLEDYLAEKQFSDNLQKTVLNKIDGDDLLFEFGRQSALNIDKQIMDEIVEIPDYLINDPEIVGYPDKEFQEEIYNWAIFDPFKGNNVSFCDIGCGRGDLFGFLNHDKGSYWTQTTYTGFETNPLMVRTGRKKYPEINIQEINWLDYDGENFDYIFFIGTLNQDYGYFDNTSFYGKYDYFKKILNHSLKFCNKSLIFILLQNAEEGFIEHQMEVIIDILCKENIPFQIDYSKFVDIYKLTIFKNND